jgi:hypothetical protein
MAHSKSESRVDIVGSRNSLHGQYTCRIACQTHLLKDQDRLVEHRHKDGISDKARRVG